MSDQELVIRVLGNDSQYTAVMRRVQSTIQRASNTQREFGHSGVTSVQAVSASLRVAQGDFTNLIRAAERFIAQSKVLSAAAKAIFPAVGLIAIGQIFANGIGEAVKFVQHLNEIPRALQTGYQQLNLSQEATIASLTITNDKLDEQLAKLEHKPAPNGAKLAFDEAKASAIEFAEQIDTTQKKLQDLMKANSISGFQSFFTSVLGNRQGSTSDSQKFIGDAEYQFQQLAYARGQATNPGDLAKANDALNKYRAQIISQAQYQIKLRSGRYQMDRNGNPIIGDAALYSATYGDQRENISNYEGLVTSIRNQQQIESLTTSQQQKQGKIPGLEAGNEAALAAQNEAAKQLEAHIKFLDQATKAWNASLKENTSQLEEQSRLAQELDKSSGEALGKSLFEKPATQGQTDAQKYLDDLSRIRQRSSQSLAEENLQLEVSNGQMSQQSAALALATLHTQQYNAALAELQDQQAHAADPNEYYSLGKQIEELQGRRQIEIAQDSASLYSTSAGGELKESLDRLTQTMTDLPAHLSDMLASSIQSINSTLSSTLIGRPHETGIEYRREIRNGLSQSFRGIASGGLNTLLQQGEGGLLQALGFGAQNKPTGTANNPLYVIDLSSNPAAGGVGGGINSITNSPLGRFVRGIFSPGLRQAQSIISSAAPATGLTTDNSSFNLPLIDGDGDSSWLDSLPGFASGGDVTAGRPILVGENGPEPFLPKTSGTIIPNGALGGVTHNWNIDARGATDPAAVEASVNRAIRRAAPSLVQASVRAGIDRQKRLPSSRR